MPDEPEIEVTYLGGAYDDDRSFYEPPYAPTPLDRYLTDLDPATYFENDPLVQGTLAHLAAEMSLTKTQRILLLGNPDDPTRAFPPVFQGRSRMYVGPAPDHAQITRADLDAMTEIKGLRPSLVWMDEMQEEPVRDERAEEARRLAAEREQADRARKDEVAMRGMNRADRRRWLRENRPR